MKEASQILESTFTWALQSTWQAGVLAILILVIQFLFRSRLSPAWRYGLWLLLVVRLLLPFSPQTSWSIHNVLRLPGPLADTRADTGFGFEGGDSLLSPQPAATLEHANPVQPATATPQVAVGSRVDGETANPVQQGRPWSWYQLASLVWILGAIGFTLRLVLSNVCFLRAIQRDAVGADESSLQLLKLCQEDLGLRKKVILIETRVLSPAIHGLWHTRLLMPKGTLSLLSTAELRFVFFHELAHLKRHDLAVNWITSVLLAIHWFNPLLWIAFAKMRNDRELACDALVLTKLGGDHKQSYGETIIKLVENLRVRPSTAGVLALSEDRQQLKERIGMIAQFKQWPRWSMLAVSLGLGVAAFGLTNASQNSAVPVSSQKPRGTDASQNSSPATLPKGIHGRIVDARGNPVNGARVDCLGFSWQKTTDEQGGFSWVGAEQAQSFRINKDGFRTLYTGPLSPSEFITTFTQQNTVKISGRVIDKETRQPIAAFKFQDVRVLQGPVTPSLTSRQPMTGSSGTFSYTFEHLFGPDSAIYIDAEGYVPVLSPPLTRSEHERELTFELTRSTPVEGSVVTPQGSPAEKAEIRLWCGELNISDIPRHHNTTSDKDGHFTVPVILDGKVSVFHDSGYSEISWQDFLEKKRIQLAEWGHVKGSWPAPRKKSQKVSLERMNWAGWGNSFTSPFRWTIASAEVRPDGTFEFEDGVPPGEYMLSESVSFPVKRGGSTFMPVLISRRWPVVVEPGRTTVVELPAGRPVIGRLDFGESLTNVHLPIVSLRLKQDDPEFEFPREDPSLSDAQNFERLKQYRQQLLGYWLSDQGKEQRRAGRSFEIVAEPDGYFQVENVPPGTYELQINASRWSGKPGPEIKNVITIPPPTNEIPVDLGVLK